MPVPTVNASTPFMVDVYKRQALQFAITSSGTMIMQSAINLFGSEAVAAYTAACKVQMCIRDSLPAMLTK